MSDKMDNKEETANLIEDRLDKLREIITSKKSDSKLASDTQYHDGKGIQTVGMGLVNDSSSQSETISLKQRPIDIKTDEDKSKYDQMMEKLAEQGRLVKISGNFTGSKDNPLSGYAKITPQRHITSKEKEVLLLKAMQKKQDQKE